MLDISLFSNATIALIVAVKALNITGEVITTPFSFVATAHSLLWNNVIQNHTQRERKNTSEREPESERDEESEK